MTSLITEIEQFYDSKIAALERQIEKLRANKKLIKSSLQEDIGDQEFKSQQTIVKSTQQPTVRETIQTDRKMNTRDRLLLALEKMPLSGFKTSDLLMAANSDGLGVELNKNRASKVFTTLINEGWAEITQHRYGREGGVYKKTTKDQQHLPSPIKVIRDKSSVSAIKRVSDALNTMEGEFSSTDLWEKASNDGRGPEIPKTSFHPKFSNILKKGLVVAVQKPAGGIAGIYKKAEMKPVESSPTAPIFSLFEEEKGDQ